MTLDAILAALADPTRRRLFEALARGPMSVAELAARQPVTRGAVSQHLKLLLDAGLLQVESRGRQRIYGQRPDGLRALREYADAAVAAGGAPPAGGDPVAAELSKWQAEAPHIDHGVLALMMYFAQIGQYVVRSSEEAAAQLGLRFSDVTLLGALRRLGPPYESTPTELSQTFWITLPGMAKRLERLEAMGLLQRKCHPDDGRSVLLRLTRKGLATLRELVAHRQPPEYEALRDMPLAEREQLSRLLGRVLDAFERKHGQRRAPYVIR